MAPKANPGIGMNITKIVFVGANQMLPNNTAETAPDAPIDEYLLSFR